MPLEDELLGGNELSADELLGETTTAGDGPRATAKVEIYTTAGCSFCRRAKRVLEAKGAAFTELRVDEDEAALQTMIKRAAGRRTVPQIFIDDQHIGGMDGLQALARAGELDARLGITNP